MIWSFFADLGPDSSETAGDSDDSYESDDSYQPPKKQWKKQWKKGKLRVLACKYNLST